MALIDVGGQRGNPTLSDWFERWHIDSWTLSLLLILSGFGMVMLYSASGHDLGAVSAQAKRLGLGFVLMILVAQAPPEWYRSGAGWLYGGTVLMLVLVLLLGDSAKGAQRWLDFGVMRFQPSELMKLAMPLAIAAYLHQRTLPPQIGSMLVSIVLIAVPTGLVMVQPDLGTSLLVVAAGGFALFFAGLRWRWILGAIAAVAATAPFLWMRLHDYQRGRILTLFNPERDPLGAGYHITQSKIAIGSGGTFGKGWLEGTQAKLDFLPEANTDFIFAVIAEELGLIGVVLLLLVYLAIVARGLLIALRAQDTFQRLLAAALTLKFFVYVFINIGMVIGLLPVVGVPLPLISYGGTSAVSLLVGFGMLMSIQTNRKLLAN
ncbi:MAG: rod shape-determining protein RodA [Polycyclovorans sp.]|jgi:rod shape determining protein RodA|nr:rod shape-determining protein RodA [Polycyclovorans sp.]MBU0791043.1 rod shape-determining protein RodA [Gammaproteobacteria bacterium]MDP1543447.1 rod shape-determining protein RodA [Polycyclovorans sp.]|tara:strand:- start:665 stop:1792 length:1128 start_codon:yes stop_codon:yes gene_type:complete